MKAEVEIILGGDGYNPPQDLVNFIKKEDTNNIRIQDNNNIGVSFVIWGNKGVDYDILDKIKDYLHDKKVDDFEIEAIEYTETGYGYYYDSLEGDE